MSAPSPAHLARLAWREAAILDLAAIGAREDGRTADARAAEEACETNAKIAEFYMLAAVLRKDGRPRE